MPTPISETTAAPTAPPSTLDELLACHDQHFVQCAYQLLLGRAPDPEGLGYSLGRLRTGFTKIRVLAQLRQSKEGKEHGATLPGLDKALQRHRQEQYPLVGWLYKQRHGAEGNHPTERKLRAIENQVYLSRAEVCRSFNKIEIALANFNQLALQQSQSAVTGSRSMFSPDTTGSNSTSIKDVDEGAIQHLTARAKAIYFRLETATTTQGRRVV